MFDLVDLLKNKETQPAKEEKLTSVLFHQTEACRELVEEAFRFEGITTPAILNNNDDNIRQHVRESTIEIVLVELNESSNVTKDMEHISHLLPNSASVIVIGSEDAISTIRNLKAMGFYYLFWPITKTELIDFVRNVNENRLRNSGLGKNRSAKKVAVLGAKGGVGVSLLTAELSKELSEKRNSSCVIVDHNFSGGNLDIMLGLKQFKKREVAPGALTASLDAGYASNMATKVNGMLSLLAIESDDLSDAQLKEYARTLSAQLASQTNFIIEDLSGSTSSKADLEYIASQADVVLLVTEPTVSSLRDATRVMNVLQEKNSTARCIIVVNHTKPEKCATVELPEIEKYLHQCVDVVCPFEPKLGKTLLRGENIYTQKMPVSNSFSQITSLLLGEAIKPTKESLLKRLTQRA